eukprot:m.101436 g.101436  ORF g.101436 m.101436 type:complete len:503 (-) comp13198_c0_seq1:137-1645(-)
MDSHSPFGTDEMTPCTRAPTEASFAAMDLSADEPSVQRSGSSRVAFKRCRQADGDPDMIQLPTEVLQHVFRFLRSSPSDLIVLGMVCRQWWFALVDMPDLWEHVSERYVSPVFPAWRMVQSRASCHAIAASCYRILSPFCYFCGNMTSWFLLLLGARVCRNCFHGSHGVASFCTAEYAMEQYGVEPSALQRLPFASMHALNETTRRRMDAPDGRLYLVNHIALLGKVAPASSQPPKRLPIRRALFHRNASPPRMESKATRKPFNLVAELQRKNMLHPLMGLSYQMLVPLCSFLYATAEPIRVSTEEELLLAIDTVQRGRFGNSGYATIILLNDIVLTQSLEPCGPIAIIGVSTEAGRTPQLSIEGARGIIIATCPIHLANVALCQFNVPANTFMCGLQVDGNATAVVTRCIITASGSGIRVLQDGRIHLTDSVISGITTMCIDHEGCVLWCHNNKLIYFGEWAVQVCCYPDENPQQHDFEAHNEVTFSHNHEAPVFDGLFQE